MTLYAAAFVGFCLGVIFSMGVLLLVVIAAFSVDDLGPGG